MTPESLADEAKEALAFGIKLTLILWHPGNMPPTFPPAEELWTCSYSRKVCYAYEPSEVLKWLEENRLIKVELQDED